jgi:hypothetical protein
MEVTLKKCVNVFQSKRVLSLLDVFFSAALIFLDACDLLRFVTFCVNLFYPLVLGSKMNVAGAFYRSIGRRFSTTLAAVAGGVFVFDLLINRATDAYWESVSI